MTFFELESLEDSRAAEDGTSSLAVWYRSVRNVQLVDLGLKDIAKAIRQRLFLKETMPIALSILREDVGAGDDYDGQLLAAVSALGHDDWSQLIIEREQIIQIIGKAEKLPNMSMEQLKDITKIKAVL